MLVRLTRKDSLQAQLLGADTLKIIKMQNVKPRHEDDGKSISREDSNDLGTRAEFAFARLMDLEPPGFNVVSDGGVDAWLTDDISVDVKYTEMSPPKLIFDSMAVFRAGIAVLATCEDEDEDLYRIHGWVTRKRFKKVAYTDNFGHGDRLVMDAEDLEPVEDLWLYKKAIENGTLSDFMYRKWGIV